MPVLTPSRDLGPMDHIERVEKDGAAGWHVELEVGGRTHDRFFRDGKSREAALERATRWRNSTISSLNGQGRNIQQQRSLGVSKKTKYLKGHEYDVIEATLPAHAGEGRKRMVRSLNKFGVVEAVQQCCAWRFEGMQNRFGDLYPIASVEELVEAVLGKLREES